MSRYRFNIRNRGEGETLEEYVSELQKLAISCNFKESTDIMLWDRLMSGINNKAIQCRLLKEPKLTLLQALRIAEKLGQSLEEVHSVSNKNNAFVCYTCGKSAYRPANYSFYPVEFFVHSF